MRRSGSGRRRCRISQIPQRPVYRPHQTALRRSTHDGRSTPCARDEHPQWLPLRLDRVLFPLHGRERVSSGAKEPEVVGIYDMAGAVRQSRGRSRTQTRELVSSPERRHAPIVHLNAVLREEGYVLTCREEDAIGLDETGGVVGDKALDSAAWRLGIAAVLLEN